MTIEIYGRFPDGTVMGMEGDKKYLGTPQQVDPSTFAIETEATSKGYKRLTKYGQQVVGVSEVSKEDFNTATKTQLLAGGMKPNDVDKELDRRWEEALKVNTAARLFGHDGAPRTVTVYDWKEIV